jgi:hypothetical protein
MTIYASVVRAPARLPLRRERWELDDGDFVDVDRLEGRTAEAPLVLILHGLEGSSQAGYVRGTLAALAARGYAGVALNFRGCSGELNRLPRFYHSGDTGDLARAVAKLVAERPGRPLGVIGFSLGGNVTAKFLAERGDDLPAELLGAVSISPPFDLAACAHALDGPGFFAGIYRTRFLRSLRAKALAKAKRFPREVNAAAARRAKGFQDFDDAITAPLAGFPSAEVYWAKSSAGPLLMTVRRPLQVILADDDPFVPPFEVHGSPSVTVERHAHGGHVAFVEGNPWSITRYAEQRAVDVLAERFGA